MGKHSDYKKDKTWTAWDMNCRHVCPVSSRSRRKLRDVIRRQSRKREKAKAMQDERDIAKMPIKDTEPRWGMGNSYYDWLCPRCHHFIAPEPAYYNIPKRCPECGQLLIKPTSIN